MKSNYKRLGDHINEVKVRNTEQKAEKLLGINIDKFFMPSVANIVGTDLSVYRLVRKNQFACNRMHVGRDYRLPISMSKTDEEFMVSPAYDVFEIKDTDILYPEYLMMWFTRREFDRNAWFYTDADVRGGLHWNALCDMQLPIPSITKQKEIVKEYNVIQNRIALNQQLIKKLEETAQAIYKQWFVNEQHGINKTTLNKYIKTNPQLSIKKNAVSTYVEMNDLTTTSMQIENSIKREFIGGSKFQNCDTLLARITPCLENGKTAFVDILEDGEVAAGSTEFIVMRAKEKVSPYWVYCLARDEDFRSYAISSMVGSSGRERVHEKYLEDYVLSEINMDKMNDFHLKAEPIFKMIKIKSNEVRNLTFLKDLLLSRLAKMEDNCE
jgi:type I restriction enzyme S subunit